MKEYIIIWRSHHRDPFVDTTNHDFLERYMTYELAKEQAEAMIDESFFDFEIFETSTD